MRFSEILTESDISFQDADEKLANAGYQRIGGGKAGGKGHSIVYHKPNDQFVLKLFNINDSAYLEFLNFCKQNPGNENLPVFKGKIVKINSDFLAIRMEKLEEITNDDDEVYIINNLFSILVAIEEYKLEPMEENHLAEKYRRKLLLQELEKYKSRVPDSLASTLEKMAIFMINNDLKDDLAPSNIMKRGNTYVFTDPFY
jgi:hypothetical protein